MKQSGQNSLRVQSCIKYDLEKNIDFFLPCMNSTSYLSILKSNRNEESQSESKTLPRGQCSHNPHLHDQNNQHIIKAREKLNIL